MRKELNTIALNGTLDDAFVSDWAKKNPWAVNVCDRNGKRPNEVGYDKTSLLIPLNNSLLPYEKQYWDIKKDNYDAVIFFVSLLLAHI